MSMINTGEKAAEQKASFWSPIIDTRKPYETEGIPPKLYLLIAVLSIVVLQLGLLTQSGVAGAAMISRVGLIAQEDIQFIQAQIIGNGFLYFVLAALVIGSVLSVQTVVLKKALVSYAPIVLGGLIVSAILGISVGMLYGVSIDELVTRYFLPIMGAGAGALPMSEVYADVIGGDGSEYFNHAIGVLTLGNLTAIC